MHRARTSRVTYARSSDLDGLEAGSFHSFVGSRVYYPRREFLFAFSDGNTGHREFQYRGETIRVPASSPVVIQAGEPYTVDVPKSLDVHWVTVDLSLFRKASGIDEARVARMPYFPELVLDDGAFARSIAKLHRAVVEQSPLNERQKLVREVVERAVSKHTSTRPNGRRGTRKADMQKARDYMYEALDRNVPLKELADMTGLSVFQFVRTFNKEIGLTPHALLIQMRAQRARELLKKGASATEASQAAGFSDPSHLVRHFKRIFKITPGAYAAAGAERDGEGALA